MISEERLRELWREFSATTLTNQKHDFARAVEREARRGAIEECAKVCDLCALSPYRDTHHAENCAQAIRALIDK